MERGSAGLVHTVIAALAMASGGLWALHTPELPGVTGLASGALLVCGVLPLVARIASGPALFLGACTFALGLTLAWVTSDLPDLHAARVVHDVGWTAAALGGWHVYSTAVGMTAIRRRADVFDDAARATWRRGDVAYGLKLSRKIATRAQPPWAALVLETAWPEPRPRAVKDLLGLASAVEKDKLVELRERMRDKTGEGVIGARWELARIACDVIEEAAARDDELGATGGRAAARFVVAAASVVGDDEEAARIFAALILPAIARRA